MSTDHARSGPLIVVMGVSGCGKSTVGEALSARLCLPFQDADDLHPHANLDRMSRGIPLTDDDRRPWLRAVGEELRRHRPSGLVMACSALRVAYRDALRTQAPDVFFLHLTVTRGVLAARMVTRGDHFMPLALLDSQLDTLEPLAPHEQGLAVNATQRIDRIIGLAQSAIRGHEQQRAYA
ncbi:gluconokinase [Microbacterium sp.]|uniref:gluconokinase n=1 Tax=Microbacterium sp. TaxID=51671 RepID=UPI002FE28755